MSNLNTARQAILAELKYVEEGAAYYQKRAAALRAALEQLESTEDPTVTPIRKAKSARNTGKPKKKTVVRKASSSKNALPKTSRDFWLQFIDQHAKTAAEVGNAAIALLGLEPKSEQARRLKSRLAPTLQALIKAKAIKDVGSGRDRKYSLASSGPSAGTKAKVKSMNAASNPMTATNGIVSAIAA